MATKKTQPIVTKTPEAPTSEHDKEEKQNGETYWLKEVPENITMKKYMIPDRTKFTECNDGSYQVYLDGDKLHFRVTKKKIEEIKSCLV